MSEKELMDCINPFKEKYDWSLIARSGPAEGGDKYLYIFIDDIGINIIVNPNNKNFRFEKIVDKIFFLKSPNMSPIDYENHFEKMYEKFRQSAKKFL